MTKTTVKNITEHGLREWASVVEALGQGMQTIVIRNSFPRHEKFLLYPTFSYYTRIQNKPDLLTQYFQSKHADFVKETSEKVMNLAKKDMYVKIKYWAECSKETVIQVKGKSKWQSLKDYFIWNPEHVLSYAIDNTSFVWVLRVYKFDEPIIIGRIPGGTPPVWYKHFEEVDLDKSKSVLIDKEFEKVLIAINRI